MRVVLFDPDYIDSASADSVANWQQNGRWLEFNGLKKIIEIKDIEKVVDALSDIEAHILEHGGYAAGWLSYEAAASFDEKLVSHRLASFPLLKFGIFTDYRAYTSAELFNKDKIENADDLNEEASVDNNGLSPLAMNWQLNTTPKLYTKAIADIKHQITEGNTYQVNYTLRQYTDFYGSAWNLFKKMSSQARYGAFIEDDNYVISSASPELFFKKQANRIYSKPMKGTSRRGMTLAEDELLKSRLHRSDKNRAENLMIVDMIRNDLSKIARKGSVKVDALFEVEEYPTVWQMTSTVSAMTDDTMVDIFKALYPCASITGAPKINTMKIINQLENSPRKVYCGAIGYIKANKQGSCDAQFSVPIRTLLLDKQYKQAEYGVGSGIVWDSDATDEYQECLIKSVVLKDDTSIAPFQLFETMRWQSEPIKDSVILAEEFFNRDIINNKDLASKSLVDCNFSNALLEKRFYLYREHAQRLAQSAQYFHYPFNINNLESTLLELEQQWLSSDSYLKRVRLSLLPNGQFNVTAVDIDAAIVTDKSIKNIKLAPYSALTTNRWLYHKTTNRAVYEYLQQQYSDYDDVLLVNEKGFITESCIANFLYSLKGDNTIYTPPVADGLLAGTYRQKLLANKQIFERSLSIDALPFISNAYLLNSLRGLYPIAINS